MRKKPQYRRSLSIAYRLGLVRMIEIKPPMAKAWYTSPSNRFYWRNRYERRIQMMKESTK